MTSRPGTLPSIFCTESEESTQCENSLARATSIERFRRWSLSAQQAQFDSPSSTASSHEALLFPSFHSRTRFFELEAKFSLWSDQTREVPSSLSSSSSLARSVETCCCSENSTTTFFPKSAQKSTPARARNSLHTYVPQSKRGESGGSAPYPLLAKAGDL